MNKPRRNNEGVHPNCADCHRSLQGLPRKTGEKGVFCIACFDERVMTYIDELKAYAVQRRDRVVELERELLEMHKLKIKYALKETCSIATQTDLTCEPTVVIPPCIEWQEDDEWTPPEPKLKKCLGKTREGKNCRKDPNPHTGYCQYHVPAPKRKRTSGNRSTYIDFILNHE